MISIISQSGAMICFVALGAPRQELFAARAIEETTNIAFIGIGGGLDFIAGTQIRCPRIVRHLYLEWAWRFSQPATLGHSLFSLRDLASHSVGADGRLSSAAGSRLSELRQAGVRK